MDGVLRGFLVALIGLILMFKSCLPDDRWHLCSYPMIWWSQPLTCICIFGIPVWPCVPRISAPSSQTARRSTREGDEAPFVGQLPGKAAAVLMGANRYVWEEDPCQEHAASLIFRQVLFWRVHKQFSGSLEVVHFTRLFKDLWHLRRAGEANNPTFRTRVFPPRSILDRNIK